jgi:hypothetical protein
MEVGAGRADRPGGGAVAAPTAGVAAEQPTVGDRGDGTEFERVPTRWIEVVDHPDLDAGSVESGEVPRIGTGDGDLLADRRSRTDRLASSDVSWRADVVEPHRGGDMGNAIGRNRPLHHDAVDRTGDGAADTGDGCCE